ncbi:MAG: menaquinone biosynthesis decarboxylase [Bacteroidales bacterium]|nr:menaquinone biosynthesis decarboxylase [Bacteroidales bacterium]
MNLSDFIQKLSEENELLTITEPVKTDLEITEITDRISKSPENRNKALLFTNNGTNYPVLINAFGSEKRICLALNCNKLDDHKDTIENIFKLATSPKRSLSDKLSFLPLLAELKNWLPKHTKRKAECQEVIEKDIDLTSLPILKCWKHDAGKFITFPMVITQHPETCSRNMGMYRMQVIDKATTGMHWHKNKTGANHYEAYKKLGKRMPVSVAIGGDPANIFSATAPLPENIDEALLTGFLRKKPVTLVKCITNDLEVPSDADFVLEGYVDPQEDKFLEGPFGDHTGFYSLPDYYPKFHITCITHRKNAIYPTTIVGIPPMEDAWMGKATERIFLAPIKMLFCPELIDYTMPFEGVSHNLVIAKIKKNYDGQVQKVINAFWGAGQMSSNKTLIIVDEQCDITDEKAVLKAIECNFNPSEDTIIIPGPLDVLDHSSPKIGFGSKLAIDATKKELTTNKKFIFLAVEENTHTNKIQQAIDFAKADNSKSVIILYDKQLDETDTYSIIWNVLNNYNPATDCIIENNCLIIDGSTKLEEEQRRDWPTPVTSDEETIKKIDEKWNSLQIGEFIPSPSLRYRKLFKNDSAWRYR